MIRLDSETSQEVIYVVYDGLGLDVSSEYVHTVLSNSLKGEIMDFGARDTLVSELICSSVSRDILGRSVPTYGEGPEVGKQFWKDLHEAARAQNIRVISDTNG